MPATDYQGSSSSLSNLGRSILSIRRDQVHSMETIHDSTSQEFELESFQRQVADQFYDLSSIGSDGLLSISWIRKLLDVFLCCHEEFRMVLFKNKPYMNRAPMDRLLSEFFERNVKALDVCNAIRDGVEQIRQWQKQLEIVLCALDNQRSLGEGQFRRSKKALIDLAIGMLDDKESNANVAHRNRSFGRTNIPKDNRSLGHFRSLSWSVSRSWSAARQLQAIGANLAAPKTNEIAATNGLAVAVFTMNCVLFFVMWALVAAIPCQDRGLQTHFYIPRQFVWAVPMLSLHERILEESKKRERRNACGLLKEIHQIQICARHMNELTDSVQFPLTVVKEGEVRQRVNELRQVFEGVKDELDPLERQVREVFHRIVRSALSAVATAVVHLRGFAATTEWKFLICQHQYLNPCVLSLFLKMSSLRNAVYRRAHKERSQPQSRKKYGLLEKHKDYVVRAKAFHKKEDALRKLKEKAAFRNPDEFYFKMIKTKTVDGVHKPESQANKYTQEELMLMKTQDIGYVLQKLQSEKNKIEKLTAVLQSLDNQPSTRHIFYAEDREDAKEMRLRTSKVGKVPVFEDVPDHIKSICRKTAASYRELEARKGRVNDLEKLYMDMAMQKELQKKGRKRKLREDEIVCPTSKPVYKWRPDRKR